MQELLATLNLAESIAPGNATWIVAGLAVLGGLAGRKRLPSGVGDGLFVAGLSGVLFAAYLPMHDPGLAGVQLCAVLTALAVLWRFAPRWTERRDIPGADRRVSSEIPQEPPPPNLPAEIASHAVLLCGAAVAGISLRFSIFDPRQEILAVTLCLILLLALTLRPRGAGKFEPAWYALVGLLACALRIWVLPKFATGSPGAFSVAVCLGGLAALLAATLPVLSYWRYRQRIWQIQPERLLDPPPPWRWWWTGVQAWAAIVGIAALVVRHEPLAPLGTALAATATSIAGYRLKSTPAGTLPLLLTCETAILATLAWVPDFGHNALLGTAAAGLWMLWLARFWRQQLLDGQPWTYAGHLVESARWLGYVAPAACLSLAISEAEAALWTSTSVSTWRGVAAGCTFLGVLLLGRGLIRDAAEKNASFAAQAACLTVLAALVPLQSFLTLVTGLWLPWQLMLASAVLLIAILAGPDRSRRAPHEWTYNAYVGGLLPVALFYTAVMQLDPAGGRFWILVLPIVLIGFSLRWWHDSDRRMAARLSGGHSNL